MKVTQFQLVSSNQISSPITTVDRLELKAEIFAQYIDMWSF